MLGIDGMLDVGGEEATGIGAGTGPRRKQSSKGEETECSRQVSVGWMAGRINDLHFTKQPKNLKGRRRECGGRCPQVLNGVRSA